MSRLGFVGAGRMGAPMVERLLARGHEVRVLARSAGRADALAAAGATPVGSVAEVGTGAEVVLVCLFDDEQVREVCLGGDLTAGMADGSVLVVHTTGSPRTVEEIAARGTTVVDAPVSGGPHDIAAGRLTLFAGGADDAVARVRPVLGAYGDPVLHVGGLGAGQRVKLVNNALFAAHIGLLGEAVRLAGQLGVAEEDLLGALSHGSAASRALAGAVARGSVDGFSAAVRDFLGKDVAVARAVATELGGDLGALGPAIGAAVP
ncbi:NAD(P)-dependent oxidoreductase [Prauserella endophytica]|uniref:NAD(P)-dependent oxidoreductase n=1 Tax=Prauserella endophytica TaxID=1592324 RepID=A0ABY2S4Z7_9PSEU|nr:NAD(P)-dependent oxidoreductase [Prauserella endophytica]PXY33317.1 6-phosphogluconate dehydrogenase [Prauserella coralliicola]TKG70894.1 NAD(P)-dependent oxidoreductase [Prauserella endophytica]